MATEKQVIANRRNGALSIGPIRGNGVHRSSQNAVRHGLFRAGVIAEGEDRGAFEELARALLESSHPSGALEEELVGRVALCSWRLRRLAGMESDLLSELGRQADVEDAARLRDSYAREASEERQLRHFPLKPEDQTAGRANYDEARCALYGVEASRRPAGLGRGLVIGGAEKSLGLLRRYESGLERGMYAAIAQLERLQARRAGQAQALPQPAEDADEVCEDGPWDRAPACGGGVARQRRRAGGAPS